MKLLRAEVKNERLWVQRTWAFSDAQLSAAYFPGDMVSYVATHIQRELDIPWKFITWTMEEVEL